jgi:hypothetical protein
MVPNIGGKKQEAKNRFIAIQKEKRQPDLETFFLLPTSIFASPRPQSQFFPFIFCENV